MGARHWFTMVTGALCASVLWTSAGRADDDSKKLCASAFANAQRQMRSGSLLEARATLIFCGGRDCPVAMHPDCQQWLSSVEASIGTVVFEVSSAEGQLRGEVRLSVDGGDATVLDGRAVSLDPGAHEVTFTSDGFRTTTTHIVVSEGEKLRRERLVLEPLQVIPAADSPARPAGSAAMGGNPVEPAAFALTAPVIVAASGAVLAGVGAVYFGLKARSDDRNLDGCAPSSSCAPQATDQVRREYLWTNLSIGLAAASATTAVVLFLVHGRSAAPTSGLSISLTPHAIGPVATGTF